MTLEGAVLTLRLIADAAAKATWKDCKTFAFIPTDYEALRMAMDCLIAARDAEVQAAKNAKPITAELLKEHGWRSYELRWELLVYPLKLNWETVGGLDIYDPANSEGEFLRLPHIKTCGDLRRLCEALGIPMKED